MPKPRSSTFTNRRYLKKVRKTGASSQKEALGAPPPFVYTGAHTKIFRSFFNDACL